MDKIIDKGIEDNTQRQVELARQYYSQGQYSDALYWYKKAADNGNADGLNGIGCCYLDGRGVEKDEEKAKDLFLEAASKGSLHALYNLGIVSPDKDFDYFLKAASLGHSRSQYKIGEYFMTNRLGQVSWEITSKRDTTKAFDWFMKAALQGYDQAQYKIGVFYESGTDPCIRNTKKALDWYFKAAAQGHGFALCSIGRLYANGIDDINPNPQMAYSYYVKAAEKGIADAQYRVGIALYQGKGIEEDKEAALGYFIKAAENGHSDAQYMAGLTLYYNDKNNEYKSKAIEWLKKAAMQMNWKAQEMLFEIKKEEETKKGGETKATGEEIANAIIDSFGVLYSRDGKKLLRYSLEENYESFGVGKLKEQSLNFYEVPDGVEIICDEAFQDCESIEEIVLPDSIRQIGECAFYGCPNLNSINIPEGIKELQGRVFYECYSLEDLVLPSTICTISEGALVGVRSIISHSPNFVVKDGCMLSKDLKILVHFFNEERTYFYVPKTVETVGPHAFEHSNLVSIILPYGLKLIEDEAFAHCESLEEITLPPTLEEIGPGAFYDCNSLYKVKMYNGLRKIGGQAFESCRNLYYADIPESVEEICVQAFASTSVRHVTLPTNLKKLGIGAFIGNVKLESLKSDSPNFKVKNMTIYNKYEKKLLQYYGHERSFEIPDHVTEIGDFAFFCAWSINELKIPKSVKTIGHCILEQTMPKRIIIPQELYEKVAASIKDYARERIEISD